MKPAALLLTALLASASGCLTASGVLGGAFLLSGDSREAEPVGRTLEVGGWRVHVLEKEAEPGRILHDGTAVDWEFGFVVLLQNVSASEPLRLRARDASGVIANLTYALPLAPGEVDHVRVHQTVEDKPKLAALRGLVADSAGVLLEAPATRGSDEPLVREGRALQPGDSFEMAGRRARFVEATWRKDDASWSSWLTLKLDVEPLRDAPAASPVVRATVHEHGLSRWSAPDGAEPWPTTPGAPMSVQTRVRVSTWDHEAPYLASLHLDGENVVLAIPEPPRR